jgi:hypothetical protein
MFATFSQRYHIGVDGLTDNLQPSPFSCPRDVTR